MRRIIPIIGIILILLLIPTSGPTSIVSPSKTVTTGDTTLSPVSTNELTSGVALSAGTVNVRKLPEIHGTVSSDMSASDQHDRSLAQAKLLMETPGYQPPGQETKTIVTALPTTSTGPSTSSSTVNTGLVLQGVSGASPNPCQCSPPDPNLAVGPNHVFEMVNLAGIVYTKTGGVAKATFGLDAFFNLPATSMSDPQIMYDGLSGRWFASIVNIPNGQVMVAISATNDPTGNYTRYIISAPARDLPDQPFIGANNDKLVVTANEFQNINGGAFLGSQYWILNKSDMLNNATSVRFATTTPISTVLTIRPVRHLSQSSSFYMLSNCVGSCVTNSLTTTSTVRLYNVTGTPPGTVTVSKQDITTSTSSAPPNADQPSTTTQLVTNDNRILAAVWENSTLWYTTADSCIPSGDTVARSCVRLVELTTSLTKAATLDQDFDYSQNGVFYYFPALSLYHGQLVVVYGYSSSSFFPSLAVTGRIPSDPANTLRTPTGYAVGAAADITNRFGDYFGAATDPTPTLSSIAWVAGEYRVNSSGALWSTSIAQVSSLSDISVSVNTSSIISGVNVTTTGNLLLRSNLFFSGNLTVTARNATGGAVLFSKTYSLSNMQLQNSGSTVKSSFILNVPVTSYPLSSDITLTLASNSTATIAGMVTRQLDMSGAGSVNIIDAGLVFHAYGIPVGDPRFDPRADLLANGKVDVIDAGIIAFYYGAPSFT